MDSAPTVRMSGARRAIIAGLGHALLVVAATVMLAEYLPASPTTDLRIYREGILAFVHGQDVYLTGFGSDHHYAFTYPTPSLILFLPLSAISLPVSRMVMWTLSAGALLVVVNLSLARAGLVRDRANRWAAVAAIGAAALWLEPVRSTFWLGQANLLLLGMVVVDCLAVRTWLPRGALLGLATAIKLTPGIVVVYLALTGQRRAALTSAGVFGGAAGLGFVIAPHQSWEYWTHYLFDARRVGRTTYVANQSIRGLLGRAFGSMHPSATLWLGLVAAAALVGLHLAVRAHQSGDVVFGAGLVGLTGLLASPISWNHHWVWVVPLLIALAAKIAEGRAFGWSLHAGVIALFYLAPFWWVEHGSGDRRYAPHGVADVVYADSYVLAGVLVLALTPLLMRSDRGVRPRRGLAWGPATPSTEYHGDPIRTMER